MDVPIISLKFNNVVEKELGYGSLKELMTWHQWHVMFMEVSEEEGVNEETQEVLADDDRLVPFCLFGEATEIWRMWGVLKKRGRTDLRVITVNQNWKRDEPEFSPIVTGFKAPQKAALLGGPLFPSYPWIHNSDINTEGWPEYVYLLCLFDLNTPEPRARVLLRLLKQRTHTESLNMAAWLCAAVDNAEFSLELPDAPKTGCEHETGLAYEEAKSQLVWCSRAVQMFKDGVQVSMKAVKRPDDEKAKKEQEILRRLMKKEMKDKEKAVKTEKKEEDAEEEGDEEEAEPPPPSVPRNLSRQFPPFDDEEDDEEEDDPEAPPTAEDLARKEARNKRVAKTLSSWVPPPETAMRQSKPVARLYYGDDDSAAGGGAAAPEGG